MDENKPDDGDLDGADNPPTSVEWSVNLDRLERFALDADRIRMVANGFDVSIGQTGGLDFSLIRTALIRRGSRSRLFWVDKRKTCCVVLSRSDIMNLWHGNALVFDDDGVVILKSKVK